VEQENKKHRWGEGKLKVGDPAPDFNLKMLDSQDGVQRFIEKAHTQGDSMKLSALPFRGDLRPSPARGQRSLLNGKPQRKRKLL
jgi:hypothetical protein